MRAVYVFFISISILFTVGCSSNDTTVNVSSAANEPVYYLDQTTSGPIKLDTFQCSSVSIRKGSYVAKKMPFNKHYVHKDEDSVTYSGTVYVAHEDPAHKVSYHSYQYYFKAARQYSDVYIKYNTFSNELIKGEVMQKVSTQERGWHLDFGYKSSSVPQS